MHELFDQLMLTINEGGCGSRAIEVAGIPYGRPEYLVPVNGGFGQVPQAVGAINAGGFAAPIQTQVASFAAATPSTLVAPVYTPQPVHGTTYVAAPSTIRVSQPNIVQTVSVPQTYQTFQTVQSSPSVVIPTGYVAQL